MKKRTLIAGIAATVSTGMTWANIWINEFEPNPFGSDPATQQVELLGTPGTLFTGSFISIDTDSTTHTIDRSQAVSGTFDTNGLLTFTTPDLENPSYTLAILNGAGPALGTIADIPSLQAISLDAIGVPDSTADEAFQLVALLGGTDFLYTGDEPKHIFRDTNNRSVLWAVNDPPSGNVAISNEGTALSFDSFLSGEPRTTSFGAVNPSAFEPTRVLINEFEPNPFGSDPATQQIELLGTPGETFSGSIMSVDTDTNVPTIDRVESVLGVFKSNGLLTVSIADLENPSFTLVLLDNSMDLTGVVGTEFDVATYVDAVEDAIGVPDITLDEPFQLGDELGGTDFLYTGDEPKLIFRDRIDPSIIWAINDPSRGEAISADGTVVDLTDFELGDPGFPSFGIRNPALVIPEPTSLALLGLGGLMIARRRR